MHRERDHPLSLETRTPKENLWTQARVTFGAALKSLCLPPLQWECHCYYSSHYTICVKSLAEKHELIIDEFGGWALFQQLLSALQEIGQRRAVRIATVATRYILQKRAVGAAIVGARHARHLPDTLRTFGFRLSEEDMRAIERVTAQAQGPEGPVYGLERVKGGRHAAIMKYNLNRPQ